MSQELRAKSLLLKQQVINDELLQRAETYMDPAKLWSMSTLFSLIIEPFLKGTFELKRDDYGMWSCKACYHHYKYGALWGVALEHHAPKDAVIDVLYRIALRLKDSYAGQPRPKLRDKGPKSAYKRPKYASETD